MVAKFSFPLYLSATGFRTERRVESEEGEETKMWARGLHDFAKVSGDARGEGGSTGEIPRSRRSRFREKRSLLVEWNIAL
jgi:hypothetical protein